MLVFRSSILTRKKGQNQRTNNDEHNNNVSNIQIHLIVGNGRPYLVIVEQVEYVYVT